MLTALFTIIEILLAMGLAGILIIIGALAVIFWLIKRIIVEIYYAVHHSKRKGGD